jgi:DNA-binding SARP family transcriptional activator
LIRAHLAEGNRSEALRQFRRCRELLAAGLSVEPSETIRQLIANPAKFSRSALAS